MKISDSELPRGGIGRDRSENIWGRIGGALWDRSLGTRVLRTVNIKLYSDLYSVASEAIRHF